MALPAPPTSYACVVDPPSTGTITWVNGAGAASVRHEVSTDGGQTWSRLDDDAVPTTSSDHTLPYPSPTPTHDATMTVLVRGKSRNAEGDSEYTPAVSVTTTEYVP